MIALHFHTTVHHMSEIPAALLSILLRDGGLCDWARHQIHMSMRRLLTDASAILLRDLMLKSQACPCGNRSGVNHGPYFSGLCCAGPDKQLSHSQYGSPCPPLKMTCFSQLWGTNQDRRCRHDQYFNNPPLLPFQFSVINCLNAV